MRISDWSSDVCSSDLLYLADRTRRAIIAMEGSARRVETAAICVSLAGGAGGRKAAERGDADLRPHRAVLCLFLQIVPLKSSQALLASLDEIGRASCRDGVGQYF